MQRAWGKVLLRILAWSARAFCWRQKCAVPQRCQFNTEVHSCMGRTCFVFMRSIAHLVIVVVGGLCVSVFALMMDGFCFGVQQ